MFGDVEIEKHKFHQYKSPIFLEDVNIDSVLVSYKISFGKKCYKYFLAFCMMIIKPLHIILPKTNAYLKSYDGQKKGMYFLIEDVDLLGKNNTIWDKICADINEFDSDPVYKKIFLTSKIKCYSDEATDFHDKKSLWWTFTRLV